MPFCATCPWDIHNDQLDTQDEGIQVENSSIWTRYRHYSGLKPTIISYRRSPQRSDRLSLLHRSDGQGERIPIESRPLSQPTADIPVIQRTKKGLTETTMENYCPTIFIIPPLSKGLSWLSPRYAVVTATFRDYCLRIHTIAELLILRKRIGNLTKWRKRTAFSFRFPSLSWLLSLWIPGKGELKTSVRTSVLQKFHK